MIENLPILAPDPARSARTVKRCHEVLARRRRELESREHRAAQKGSTMEQLLVSSVCVVYLVSAARTVAQLWWTR
jgi:hypothetical protein